MIELCGKTSEEESPCRQSLVTQGQKFPACSPGRRTRNAGVREDGGRGSREKEGDVSLHVELDHIA